MLKSEFYRPITPSMPLRLTPGPFEVSPSVSTAAESANCGHRTPYFRTVISELREMLIKAYGIRDPEAYGALVLTGTGSAAMEMMVCSTVRANRPLAIVNGRFGRRLADMALLHNPATLVLEFPPGQEMNLSQVEQIMGKGQTNQVLFCIQDTRDAILNPFRQICALAKRYAHLVTVDAISAAIFEDIDIEECKIDMFVDSSGKGARSLPGVGILVARQTIVDRLRHEKAGSYYLDLVAEYDIQSKFNEPRFAPAVSLYVALHQALRELLKEGVTKRRDEVVRRTNIVRTAFEQSGLFQPLRRWSDMPISVSSVILPNGLKFWEVEQELHKKCIALYSGSSIRDDVLQIGTGGFMTDDILREGVGCIIETVAGLTKRSRANYGHAT